MPGENGRLVFDGQVSGEGQPGGDFLEIYTMNLDGSEVHRLTFDGGEYECCKDWGEPWALSHNRHPVWSPDGNEIAYVHADISGAAIRVMSPEGVLARSIPTDFQSIRGLAWSSDGESLAIRGSDVDDLGRSRVGIWVLDLDDSGLKLLVSQVFDDPDPEDPVPVEIGWPVAWSPAGDEIAFEMHDAIHLIRPDGSDHRAIPCGFGETTGWRDASFDPEWSPDGRLLYCASGLYASGDSLGPAIWTYRLDDGESGGPFWLGDGNASSNPVVSPDGAQVLVVSPKDGKSTWWNGDQALWPIDFVRWDMDWQPRQGSFWDDEESVFESDIEWMADAGITKGCNPPLNDKYCPEGVATRGQMAAFLVRALGLADRLENPFTDDDDSIFEADIERLAAAGITKGCNPPANDLYCPDAKVTRGQMAAFLVRALGYTDSGGGDLFIDDDDSIFEADIDRLGTAGVTKGCNPPTNDRYCPNGNVTRGQMAAFLHRALG